MAPSTVFSSFLLIGVAVASNLCHIEDGVGSETCFDDAASFVQISTNQIRGKHEQGGRDDIWFEKENLAEKKPAVLPTPVTTDEQMEELMKKLQEQEQRWEAAEETTSVHKGLKPDELMKQLEEQEEVPALMTSVHKGLKPEELEELIKKLKGREDEAEMMELVKKLKEHEDSNSQSEKSHRTELGIGMPDTGIEGHLVNTATVQDLEHHSVHKQLPDGGLRFKASPVDCSLMTKPLQVVAGTGGYYVKELDVSTGEYTDVFDVPFSRVAGGYKEINGCGINPVDSFIYCTIFAEGAFIIRVGAAAVEFVAWLPWANYNTGGFAATGDFYIATNDAAFMVVKELHKAKGFSASQRKSPKILDLRQASRMKPEGFFNAADVVPVDADLQGNGIEEYIFVLYGARLQIAKYDSVRETFTETWIIPVTPARWDYLYGAGWNYMGKVFFADNNGNGVYMIETDKLNLKEGIPDDFKLELKLIGSSDKIAASDGMNCLSIPSPWATGITPFDCSVYPGPIQALIHDEGYDVKFLDLKSGNYSLIYTILKNRTSTPFKFMNAFSISPDDFVVYASLVMDDWDDSIYPTPPPFYIVRVDAENIEFVAKVQAPFGSPIAGSFDKEGNYYIVSNPSLLTFPGIGDMKGFTDPQDKSLPFYGQDSSVITIRNMSGAHQIADIVAVTGNFDGKGNSSWVLAVNAYMELIAMKPEAGEYFILGTNDVLQIPNRQNFGAGWNFMGEVFFASNDGAGVFQVPLADIQVPDGPSITLEKVGDSDPIYNNDGMNCIRTYSPFHKKAGTFIQPFGTRLLDSVKETALSLVSWMLL